MLPKTKTIKLTQTEFNDLPKILYDDLLNSEIEKQVNKNSIKNELFDLNLMLKEKYGILLFDDEDFEKTLEALNNENIELEYMPGMNKLIFYIPQGTIKELAIAKVQQIDNYHLYKNIVDELLKTVDDKKQMSIIVDTDTLITNNNKVLSKEVNQNSIAVSNLLMEILKEMSPYLISICRIYKEAEQKALEELNNNVFYIDKNFNIYETVDKRTEEVKIKSQKLGL